MIVVMGATGHTGQHVADALLKAGVAVRVVGRSKEKLEPFMRRGAEASVGNVEDDTFLGVAFRGASAVYAMIPPDYGNNDYFGRYDRIGAAIEAGLRASGVRKVVFLSSLGGELTSGTGPIVGLHRQERRLERIPGIELLILRPGWFMENLLGNIALIKSQGINGGAIEPDARFPMIAAKDVGGAAAEALRSQASGTGVRELLGQRDLTMREATAAIGAKIGKPDLAYVRFPDTDFEKALVGAGLAPTLASLFVEMSRALSSGRIVSHEGRTARNTTPTSIEDFAAAFATAYARA